MPSFRKMNGLGNDFAVVDARTSPFVPGAGQIAALADRQLGIGFDQLITVEPPRADGDAFMRIHNPDGGEVEACGNATRCLADVLLSETGRESVGIETVAGLLVARRTSPARVVVDMGRPRLGWEEIPLAPPAGDPLAVAVPAAAAFALPPGIAVNVGNPHIVFLVADAAAIPVEVAGPAIEHDPLFPERVNVSFASLRADGGFDVRVWERAAGATLACGTAACAVAVAASLAAATDSARGTPLAIHLPGGELGVAWGLDDRLSMEGPIALDYVGEVDAEGRTWRRTGEMAAIG